VIVNFKPGPALHGLFLRNEVVLFPGWILGEFNLGALFRFDERKRAILRL